MASRRAGKKSGKDDDPQASPDDPGRGTLQCGRLCLMIRAGEIYRDGEPLTLAPKEFELLSTFMRHSGEVLPRSFLIHEIWDTDYLGDTRMLDVHIRWLRRKIEDDPSSPTYLRTVRGVGYRFEAPVG